MNILLSFVALCIAGPVLVWACVQVKESYPDKNRGFWLFTVIALPICVVCLLLKAY